MFFLKCLWLPVAIVHCIACTILAQSNRYIQPYEKDPSYWQYEGRPVLLLGGTRDDNLLQILKLKSHLDSLQQVGGNYIRDTMSDRDPGNARAFVQNAEGKYDLNQWDETCGHDLFTTLNGVQIATRGHTETRACSPSNS
jgi:hypothetical protein